MCKVLCTYEYMVYILIHHQSEINIVHEVYLVSYYVFVAHGSCIPISSAIRVPGQSDAFAYM